MKASIQGLKDDAEFADTLASSFIVFNVYCKSVKDEHGKRGPEGPYQFEGDGAPMVVVKRWDGHEFYNNVGWVTDAKAGTDRLRGVAQDALNKNGEVVPVDTKAATKLLSKFDAAAELAEAKPGKGYEEFAEIAEALKEEKDRKKKSALKDVKKAYKGVEAIEKKVEEQLATLD